MAETNQAAGPADASQSTEREPRDMPLPPGPDEWPLVGSTFGLMRDPIGFLEEVSSLGDVVTYHVAGQRFTVLLHPHYIEQVLVSDHDRFRRWAGEEWGDLFRGYAQNGLLLSEGEQWRRQRRVIQNGFTMDRIQSYSEAMVEETERVVAEWDDGERIDLKAEMSRLTLRILTASLFDLDMSERGEAVRDAANALNDGADIQNLSALLPKWIPTPTNRRIDRTMGTLESVLEDVIEERRDDAAERDDLLSILLSTEADDGTTLTDAEIRDQLITFLFAGHETTALALTYAFHELGHDPDSRERLREELTAVTGGDPPTFGDLPSMTDTEGVVKETLRLYPPAYGIFRQATEETSIAGYRIPEGSKVTLPQIHVHRDGRFYDRPEQFRPERWSDGLEDEIPDYAYFPFGGGPRHCIGMRMATMELKHAIPVIAEAVDLEPLGGHDLSFDTGITLQPAEPVEMRVRKR